MSRIISVVSGKGGVGKTTTAINLAYALHDMGEDVLLVDGSLSAPDIHIQFGAKDIEKSLLHVMKGEMHFSDALHVHSSGLKILPSAGSIDDLKGISPRSFKGVLSSLENFSDYVIVDGGSGISEEVIAALEQSDEVLVVTTPEESAVDNASKTIQVARGLKKTVLGVVLNMVGAHRHELSAKEVEAVLGYPIIESVPYDSVVKKSSVLKHPLLHTHSKSRPARRFSSLARLIK
jgi:septum site-determining protein MinD